MRRKNRMLSCLMGVLALCLGLALTGCGNLLATVVEKTNGVSGSNDYVGYWQIESARVDGEEAFDSDDIENMRSSSEAGTNWIVFLDDDGTGIYDAFGTVEELVWDADDGTLTTTDDNATLDLSLEDGKLKLTEGDDYVIFSKGGSDLADQIELDQKTAEENTDNYNYTTEEDTSSSSSVNTDELNTYQDINSVTMADDSTCTIVIKQKGMDESGQVGYVAEVTNNSSDTISLYSRYQKSSVDGVTHELWTINASAMEPGESRTAFFYFDDLTSISDLVNVKLSITPYVDDTLEDITTYEVTIP